MIAAPRRQPVMYCPCGCTTFGPALACPKCGKRPLDWPDDAHRPNIENEVLTVVWSTVRATGETTLRVTFGTKVASWSVTHFNDQLWLGGSPQGWSGFSAASKRGAIMGAITVLGGWK